MCDLWVGGDESTGFVGFDDYLPKLSMTVETMGHTFPNDIQIFLPCKDRRVWTPESLETPEPDSVFTCVKW